MKKADFIKRCYDIKIAWLDNEIDAYIAAAIDRGAVDLERVPEHYGAVYPLLGAIFEDVARQCIYGGSDGAAVRRAVNKIKPKLHARGAYYSRENINKIVFEICDNYINPCGVLGDCFSDDARALAEKIARVIQESPILRAAHLSDAVCCVCSAALAGDVFIFIEGCCIDEICTALYEVREYTRQKIAAAHINE